MVAIQFRYSPPDKVRASVLLLSALSVLVLACTKNEYVVNGCRDVTRTLPPEGWVMVVTVSGASPGPLVRYTTYDTITPDTGRVHWTSKEVEPRGLTVGGGTGQKEEKKRSSKFQFLWKKPKALL